MVRSTDTGRGIAPLPPERHYVHATEASVQVNMRMSDNDATNPLRHNNFLALNFLALNFLALIEKFGEKFPVTV